MFKFFIILALIWMVYIYLKYASNIKTKNQNNSDAVQKQVEHIIPCAHCGLYIPMNESISADNLYFCCGAHHKEFLKQC